MPEYLTPGVYLQFVDQAPPVIRQTRMDIAGFVGLAERGPLHTPVQVNAWRQFQAVFGNFVPYSFLAYAVKGFFENGGRTCFIVRVAGYTAARASYTLRGKAGQPVVRLTAANEGTWGNQIALILTQVRPSACDFSLLVIRERRDRESFSNLSIEPGDERYFVRVLNEGTERSAPSQWVQVEDLLPPDTPRDAALLPDPGASGLVNRAAFLSGGQDGIASLTRDDLVGPPDPLAPEKRGLSALWDVDAVGIVAIPDLQIQPPIIPTAPPAPTPPRDPCCRCEPTPAIAAPTNLPATEQPPRFTPEEVLSVQRAMIEHCELKKDRVAILDAPVRPGGAASGLAEILDWRAQFDSPRGFGALYYPWIKVLDPLALDGSPVRAVPPCGHIAGIYAFGDATVGVHKAPANAALAWAEDVTAEVDDERQAVLNPEGVNVLRAFPGRGIRVYGARTLSSDPDWRYVNVRRLLLMIEEAVDEATQWAVFEPHTFNLRQTLVLSLSGFLQTLWQAGALVGTTPVEAFYVKCDETNNPPASVDQGRLIVDIGVAPTHPAEFIVLRVGRTVEELDIVER